MPQSSVPDLVYKNAGDVRLMLDLYRPATGGPFPVLLFVPGGDWVDSVRRDPHCEWLTESGIAVASMDYRLRTQATYPAQVEDVKDAVRFLRKRARTLHLDPRHIALAGHSSGGLLTNMAALTARRNLITDRPDADRTPATVSAAISFAGETDLAEELEREGDADGWYSMLAGGPAETLKIHLLHLSPVTNVTRDSPPFLLMHGERDRIVVPKQSELLRDALRRSRRPVQWYTDSQNGHNMLFWEQSAAARRTVETFLNHSWGRPRNV